LERSTLAMAAPGGCKLIGPALIVVAGLFPIVFLTPLLNTKILFFSYNEIILVRIAYNLFFIDKFLFVVVFIFGMLLPVCKMLISILCRYQFPISVARRWGGRLAVVSKLSMLDVMLLAVFIVAFKGTGIGTVQIRYGLYFYVLLILGSLLLNLAIVATDRLVESRQQLN
jgi:paraquat-inducible protein A